MKHKIADANCIVVKVGSSLLVDELGSIRRPWLESLINDVVECWKRGQQVLLVSSGAIALGRRHLHLKSGTLHLEEKQAAASVGQIKLAHAYQEMLASHGITGAQVLLTLEDSKDEERYRNAKNTFETLLKLRAIPVINENDTVATAEIRFGDNDRLAALVAKMVNADTLILLSDIEGFYTANPQLDPLATLIPEVKQLTPEILAMAGDSATQFGSGGMISKLTAAQMALESNCRMVIAAGKHLNPLKRIDQVATKTWFVPELEFET